MAVAGANIITGSEAGDTALGGDSTYKASAEVWCVDLGLLTKLEFWCT